MSNVGTSNGPSHGWVYNEVSAFVCSDDVVQFVFAYTDPETHRVRFGVAEDKPDELIVDIALADLSTMSTLASVAADAVRTGLERKRIRRQIADDREAGT